MSGSKVGSAAVVAAVTMSMAIAPSILGKQEAYAADNGHSVTSQASKSGRSKSPSGEGKGKFTPKWIDGQEPKDGKESPARKVLRESLIAGEINQEDLGVIKAISTNPKHPELGRLPFGLKDKNDVIAEMFKSGPGSTATMGALVTEEVGRPYEGQEVAHKLTLHTSDEGNTVTGTDLDDGFTYTFHRGQKVASVAGWEKVHGEVRVHIQPRSVDHLTLKRLYPFSFKFDDFKPVSELGKFTKFAVQNRQMLGKHDEAMHLVQIDIASMRHLEELFAPATFAKVEGSNGLSALLEGKPDGYQGLLRDNLGSLFHVVRHYGNTLLYGNNNGPVSSSEMSAPEAFLPASGTIRLPSSPPRRDFSTLPENEWMPTTQAEAVKFITTVPKEKSSVDIEVAGMLGKDVPRLSETGERMGVLYPRGTKIEWTTGRVGNDIYIFEKIGDVEDHLYTTRIRIDQFLQRVGQLPSIVNTFVMHY